MNNLKVKGYDNLIRDPKTNAIINTNMSEYQEYIMRKEAKNKEDQKIQNLEKDLDNIKDDLNEIKNLLRNLANGS
jgi:predicted transcriptional regulator